MPARHAQRVAHVGLHVHGQPERAAGLGHRGRPAWRAASPGAQATTVAHAGGSQRLQHGRRVAARAACPTTATGVAVDGELLGQRRRRAPPCPATLWAPSTSSSGWRPRTSSRPGHPHRGEGLLDHLGRRAGRRRTPRRGQRARRRSRPGGRRAAARARPRSGRPGSAASTRRPPTATWLDAQPKSRPGHPDRRPRPTSAAAWSNDGDQVGAGSPTTTRLPGLMMPGLVLGDALERRARAPRCGRS